VRELQDEIRRFKALERRKAPGRAPAEHPAMPAAEGTDVSEAEMARVDLEDDDPDDGERCLVRIPAADFVVAVFDELRDLFGALNGRDGSRSELIEALLGESASSGVHHHVESEAPATLAGELSMTPLRVGVEDAAKERALAKATRRWSKLAAWELAAIDERKVPREMEAAALRRAAKDLLFRTFEVGLHAGQGDAQALHRQFKRMVELEDEIENFLGDHLVFMSRRQAWKELGFASLAHYASERLGIRRSTALKRAQLSAGLRWHHKVRKAYRQGELGQEKVLLLRRLLVRSPMGPKIEEAWVRWAKTVSVRRMGDLVRQFERDKLDAATGPPKRRSRDREQGVVGLPLPSSDCPTELGRVEPDEGDIAAPELPDVAPEPLLPISDEAWIASLFRAPGMGIDRLQRWTHRYLEEHAPEPLPHPNVCIELRLRRDLAEDLVRVIEVWHGRVTAAALWLDLEDPKKPFDHPETLPLMAVRAARLFTERSRRPPVWVGFLALLENAFRAWDDPRLHVKHAAEGTYRKAGWRCMAPGCTARAELQNHHIHFRSARGSNHSGNLIALCRWHHMYGVHGVLAGVQGRAPLGLLFRLGRREHATYWVNDRLIENPNEAPPGTRMAS
jgi:hypothetical protein